MYKALHSDITIKKSTIHGMGIFSIRDIPKDTVLGISHVITTTHIWESFFCMGFQHSVTPDYIRTPLGGFINHSDKPNCIKVRPIPNLPPERWPVIQEGEEPSSMAIRTKEDIQGGEELTVYYTLYKVD